MRKLVKMVRGGRSFFRLVKDMNRTDEVFAVVNRLRDPEMLRPVAEHFRGDPQGARALTTWPRVGRIDVPALSALPPATVGRAYANHLTANKLDPNFYPAEGVHDELDFLRVHLYETHDLWHVATGFGTHVAGEIGLQSFYAAQFPMGPVPPVLMAAALLNAVFYDRTQTAPRIDAIATGFRMGQASRPLFGLEWAKHWERPLADLQAEYGLSPAQPPSIT